jgi:hypothetical protein
MPRLKCEADGGVPDGSGNDPNMEPTYTSWDTDDEKEIPIVYARRLLLTGLVTEVTSTFDPTLPIIANPDPPA